MGKVSDAKQLQSDLAEMLAEAFPGIEIEAGSSKRWKRPSVVFRWGGFADQLPEERFHRLVQRIPEEFRAERMAGYVWLELAPKETIDAFLKLPRSEDIAPREEAIYEGLLKVGFFDAIDAALGPRPDAACSGGFSKTEEILTISKMSATKIRDAKLVFIRHGVYCDCQILYTVQHELAELHVGVV